MTSLFTRSAVEYYSKGPVRPDLAFLEIDTRGDRHVITWDQVMEARRKRQAEQLRRKREVAAVRAYKLWVAYFDQDLMGGWQAMLEDWRGRGYDIWIDRDRDWLKPKLMKAFPLVLAIGSVEAQWQMWKPEFARRFERRWQDRQPLGVAYLWWDGSGAPKAIDRL